MSGSPLGWMVRLSVVGLMLGCGPQGHYSRTDAGLGAGDGGGADGSQPDRAGGAGGGGGLVAGTGGALVASGGAGGTVGTGGRGGMAGAPTASGGAGMSTGGTTVPSTGGVSGTGGVGAGGAVVATGGMGVGGMIVVGTGGSGVAGGGAGGTLIVGTGGAGTGGMGTAGAAGMTGAAGMAGTGGTTGTGGVGPRIMSIDFVGGHIPSGTTTVTPAPAMTAAEVAGVKPAANWNSAPGTTGTLMNLKLSDGTATPASVNWTSPPVGSNPGIWKNRYTDLPGDQRMMAGYLDPTANTMPARITVSALPPSIASAGYDVYVYMVGEIPGTDSRLYSYAIGTTTMTVRQTGPAAGSVFPGYTLAPAGGAGNYVVFRNVRNNSFVLTSTPAGANARSPVNGIQIVAPTGW